MSVRRALALAAALPLLVAGCSQDDPEPKMPDTSPSSSSSTPTAEPTKEQESPEEFVRRWQAAGDEMQQTGQTSEYLEMSLGCQACKKLATTVREVYDGGGRIEFAGSRIVSLERSGQRPPTFDIGLRVPRTVIHGGSDSLPESYPAGEMRIRVTLKAAGDSWVTAHYGVL